MPPRSRARKDVLIRDEFAIQNPVAALYHGIAARCGPRLPFQGVVGHRLRDHRARNIPVPNLYTAPMPPLEKA